jgi:ribosomal protein S1
MEQFSAWQFVTKDIWPLLSGKGIFGIVAFFLLIIIVLLVQNPDRANKFKLYILLPLYNLFKIGSKQYIAAKVGSDVTSFIDKKLGSQIPTIANSKIRVKWVTTSSDPVLSKDGTLILRLEETNDQTRNIMAATRSAIQLIVCPTLRDNIQKHLETAIDMTLMHKLADTLGKHAHPVFVKYFLNPEVGGEQKTSLLLQKLIKIDQFGIFVSIFIEEIDKLGALIYSTGDNSDKTAAIVDFLEFLLSIATRDVDELTPLDYISQDIKISVGLLAKTSKANSLGVTYYIDIINYKIPYFDSIYLITYPSSKDFLPRLIRSMETEKRLTLVKNIELPSIDRSKLTRTINVTLFQRNFISPDVSFEHKVSESGVTQGSLVDGIVIDVSPSIAAVKVGELSAIIIADECSWKKFNNCNDFLTIGTNFKFQVKKIDNIKGRLELSLKFLSEDPWLTQQLPKIGEKIEVKILSRISNRYIARYTDAIQVIIPKTEVSWTNTSFSNLDRIIGTSCLIIIYDKIESDRILLGSIVRLKAEFWRNLDRSMPKGTKLKGKVSEINQACVRVSLPNDLEGEIPRASMLAAGFEYADYETALVKDQGLNVVVTKVNIGEHRIILDLERNYENKMRQHKL